MTPDNQYHRNHYVPEWYQKRFLPKEGKERKFFYLDLQPETRIAPNGTRYQRKDIMRWGPDSCFMEEDLYTTKFGDIESTEIEQKFFGEIDAKGKSAVEYFADFEHPSIDGDAFNNLMIYMSTQKLRTPKGLNYLSKAAKIKDKNHLLFSLQRLQQMFCALWTESVWQIVDCKTTETKLIISDHPVTVYNKGCFPQSQLATFLGDPDVWLNGTHTLFPLSDERLLILTHTSWVRCPYGNPLTPRPNPGLFRQTIFNFTEIQTHRELSEDEILRINYIIKTRAKRYIAAKNKEWLYPERKIRVKLWSDFGDSHLLMPDPRSVSFSSGIAIGYRDGSSFAMDEYGRRPWQAGYSANNQNTREWETFQAFKGEFARLFGPKRRGRTMGISGNLDEAEDSADYHAYHLHLESTHRKRPSSSTKRAKR